MKNPSEITKEFVGSLVLSVGMNLAIGKQQSLST